MKYIFLGILFLVGCTYPSKKDFYSFQAPEKGKAVVYLYRSNTSIDSLNPDVPRFYVNKSKLGKLSTGGFYRVEVDPGEISLIYKNSLFGIPFFWKSGEVKFVALDNHVYYVKFSIESVMRSVEFKPVPNAIGEQEIKETRLLVQ